MARNVTDKVLTRMCTVLEVLRELGGVATMNEIIQALQRKGVNLSYGQVYYALRKLSKEGLVSHVGHKRLTFWYLAELSEEEVKEKIRAKVRNGDILVEVSNDRNGNEKSKVLELLQYAREEILADLLKQYENNPDLYDKLKNLDKLLAEAIKKLRQTLYFDRLRGSGSA